MAFDGKWNIEIASPMGVQKASIELKVDGDKITGTQAGAQGSSGLEGKVSGDTATWSASVTSPMPMTLEFTVTESGDALSGSVKAGSFGSFPVKGVRA